MAVTIKRIAELAGVSTGTVDRALHDRGRVDPKVAKRVTQIAEELHYQPNSVAKSLSIRSRKLKIAVILHIETLNDFFSDVRAGILRAKEEIRDFGIGVEVYTCKDFDPACQLARIDQAIAEGANAIAIVPINAQAIRDRLNRLHDQGFPVVFLSNTIEDAACLSFVGCDYHMAGEVTAGLLHTLRPRGGKLLLFSPSFQMRGHVLRARGLKERLESDYPEIRLQEVYELSGDAIADYQLTCRALKAWPGTDLIVCPGAYSGGNLQALEETAGTFGMVCYDYSARAETMIRRGEIAFALLQSPQDQGYMAVKTLFDYLASDRKPKYQNNYVRLMILLKENLSEVQRVRREFLQEEPSAEAQG